MFEISGDINKKIHTNRTGLTSLNFGFLLHKLDKPQTKVLKTILIQLLLILKELTHILKNHLSFLIDFSAFSNNPN